MEVRLEARRSVEPYSVPRSPREEFSLHNKFTENEDFHNVIKNERK